MQADDLEFQDNKHIQNLICRLIFNIIFIIYRVSQAHRVRRIFSTCVKYKPLQNHFARILI